MPVPQRQLSSIGDLLKILPTIFGTPSQTVWFRGHCSEDWKLLPSLIRTPDLASNEMVLMKRFKQQSFPFLDRVPQYEWEWMFLMQHYGVPTRLLDWTESPLVGLYFALLESNNRKDRKKNGVLWCLYPIELNQIAKVTPDQPHDIPTFGDDTILDPYLPSRVIGVTGSDKIPLAIIAPRQFKRLHAQQGVFTLFHRNPTSIEDLGDKEHVYKLVIPLSAKDRIRKELQYLMINELAVFPELEKVGRRISEIEPWQPKKKN